MKCPYCNQDTDLTKPFCKNCGSPLTKMKKSDISERKVNEDPSKKADEFDIELQNAFMGPKAKNFRKENFNVIAFFLETFYLVFRKMYVLAAFILLILVLIFFFLPNLLLFISEIIPFGFGFFTNKYYLKFVERKVNKIKANNPYASKSELLLLCKKAGGTSVLSVIIFPFIFIIALFIFTFGIVLLSGDYDFDEDYANKPFENANPYVLTGDLYYEVNYELEHKITYEDGKYLNTYIGDNNNCSITSYLLEKYKNNSKEDLAEIVEEKLLISSTLEHELEEKIINGHTWYTYVEDSSMFVHHYVTTYNDYVYYVQFSAYRYGNICKSSHSNLENTLKFNYKDTI